MKGDKGVDTGGKTHVMGLSLTPPPQKKMEKKKRKEKKKNIAKFDYLKSRNTILGRVNLWLDNWCRPPYYQMGEFDKHSNYWNSKHFLNCVFGD